MLYFAYGSNLNPRIMRRRCPEATPVMKFELHDAKLIFRGVADCIYEIGSKCQGAIWRLTRECISELDRFEGIHNGHYRREIVPISGFEGETRLMLYVMNSTGIYPPAESYLASIREGYRHFNIPMRGLNDAVNASWDDKNPTHRERNRHRRAGRPTLARAGQTLSTGLHLGNGERLRIVTDDLFD